MLALLALANTVTLDIFSQLADRRVDRLDCVREFRQAPILSHDLRRVAAVPIVALISLGWN